MSASDKHRALTGLGLALASCLALAGMGQTARPAPATDPGVATEAPGGAVQLRCWQQGRLLFDNRSLEAMPVVPGAMVAAKGQTSEGPLQLIALADAVCLVLPNPSAAASTGGTP